MSFPHACMVLFGEIAVPRDVPLPLPLDEKVLKAVIIAAFLLHLLFVNLMVGGSILTFLYELIGLRIPKYDVLAQRIAATVTVNKSVAVVLGVGPLLMISLAYTVQWYAANSLTSYAWLMVIPLVTIAFLLTYVHKYTWRSWNVGKRKAAHVAVGAGSLLLFLVIPFIFLANINVMSFPDRWSNIHGTVSAFLAGNGNAIGRYLHFLAASVAVTSLFLCIWLTRSTAARDQLPEGFAAAEVRRHFYRITFFATLSQFLIGPTLLLILPHVGISVIMLCFILTGATIVIALLIVLQREIRAPDDLVGRRWHIAVLLLFVVVLSMGSGRQFYREVALIDHQWKVRQRTEDFLSQSERAYARYQAGFGAEMGGKELFQITCSTCHHVEKAASAPSLKEIAEIYADRPKDIVAWAKAPGRKRKQFAPMPSFAHVGDDMLQKVAEYMLEAGGASAPVDKAEDDGAEAL